MIPPENAPAGPTVWRALLGDYPATHALRLGDVVSPQLQLHFADEAVPNKAFKRVVRDLEFDIAELALMTFLMARSRGVPLRLFPVVLFSRNPLPYLVCCANRGRLGPRDLIGRRVGVRAYTTTTAVWTRALLADRFGVDPDRIQWVTYEEGHVAGVDDPPNVLRDPERANLVAALLDGAIDAAIVDPVPADPRIVPVVSDPEAVHRAWQMDTGARTLNHVMVVRESLADDRELIGELFRLFRNSREQAGLDIDPSCPPLGLDANRRSLEVALAAAESQRLLAQPLAVEDLVTDVLAALVGTAK
jgi:4,5-dihydroxyphthalate decarboxylase